MGINFEPNNPQPYLTACAVRLNGDDAQLYPLVATALNTIRDLRKSGDPSLHTPVVNAALHQMLASADVAQQIVARYIMTPENLFPFQVKEEQGTVLAKRYYPRTATVTANFNPVHAPKTAYVANIPIVFNEDFVNNDRRVFHVLNTLRDQSFGETVEESQQESASRIGVVFGANRFRSIEKSKNRAFKDYVQGFQPTHAIHSSMEGFMWQPIWTSGRYIVSLKTVRRYYTLIKRLDPQRAETFRRNCEQPVRDEGINDRVPYQQIRETTKNSACTTQNVQMLRAADSTRKVYLAIMDPDIIRLNNDGAGLFTHYDRLIHSHTTRHGVPPAVATTGYRANEDEFPILRYGIILDMRMREAIGRIAPLAAYFPEPNFIISIQQDANTVEASFVNPHSVNQESRQIIADLLRRRGLSPAVALAFQSIGALTTEMPPRFITESVKPLFNHTIVGQLKILKAFSGIRQSILRTVWGWGMSAEQVITPKGASMRKFSSKIYRIFNPIKISRSKLFSPVETRYSAPRHFLPVLEHYPVYAEYMSRIARELVDYFYVNASMTDMFDVELREDHQLFFRHQSVQDIINEAAANLPLRAIREIFLVQIRELVEGYNGLIAGGLTPDEFSRLIAMSRAAGQSIYSTLREIYHQQI